MAVSSVNVNCNPVENNKCSFKGKWERNENGTPYYKTNSAMKIGGTLAGIGIASRAFQYFFSKPFDKLAKDLPNAELTEKYTKYKNKSLIVGGIIVTAAHLGSAAFIDYKRNQKAKETADFVKQVGTKNAVLNQDNVMLSNKQRAYYDSNVGSKYGGWLGALSGVIIAAASLNKASYKDLGKEIEKNISKDLKEVKDIDAKKFMETLKTVNKVGLVAGAIGLTGLYALGGWLLGKWSDHIANNDARKHA